MKSEKMNTSNDNNVSGEVRLRKRKEDISHGVCFR